MTLLRKNTCASGATEGVYEFKHLDDAGNIKDYTGQSKNIEKRLAQHGKNGKVPIKGTVKKTEVKGGKTKREIRERKILQSKGGPGGNNSNKNWSVSDKRKADFKKKGEW